jgi:hexokinase
MTNAYTKRSQFCRIGVILGTGTNAAYSDPELGDLIVNIEWGGFDKLPRRTKFDVQVDNSSPNKGKQFLEKMVSGLYLGELFRLAANACLNEPLLPEKFALAHAIETADISNLLTYGPSNSEIFANIDKRTILTLTRLADAIIERSAAVAAAALAAVITKATSESPSRRCEVGIDGSVYTKCHRYKDRLMKHLLTHLPGEEITLDFSEDGSGLGAALVAAAISRGRQISD